MTSELDQLRIRHRASLLSGRVQVSTAWGQECIAYNVIIRPTGNARTDLHSVARKLAAGEPQLLCVPADALHVSVAWLLAVHREYPRAKSEIWAERGTAWLRGLRQLAHSIRPFEICYDSLVATDSAIIAVAEPSEPVNDIRAKIANELDLLPESRSSATIVHSTLCRYRGPLNNPESVLRSLDGSSIVARSQVSELEVSKEVVYPSLKTECVTSLPLATG